MLKTAINKKQLRYASSFLITQLLLLHLLYAQQQPPAPAKEIQTVVSDSMLPSLVSKVAFYTATIDHTDFLIRRKFNLTPISLNMPEIERKVKGFKTRLEKNGSRMNLRSLNSGVIMLKEITDDLTAYQVILTNFSNELTQSNSEVKKIIRDPILNVEIPDSIIQDQLDDIQSEGLSLDSLQQITIARVNMLRNKVSVNLLEASDVISDMRYLNISLKLGIWKQEEAPLLEASPKKYNNTLGNVTLNALTISGQIILIYLNEKWNVITVGMLVFGLIIFWTWINMRIVKKQPEAVTLLAPVHFLSRGVLIACLMALFTYLPFFFANPPMSLLHTFDLLRIIPLVWLIYPYLVKKAKFFWILLCLLWAVYAMDDLLLESAFGERWLLFFAAILLAVIAIKIAFQKTPFFKKIAESPATKALAVFTFIQVALSLVFNITGRVSLAKIFGVSAIQCLMLGVSLKVFCAMVMETVYLQSEAYHESRFSAFINFTSLQQRLTRILWILASIVWTISLARNLSLYDVTTQLIGHFFSAVRTIGNMTFTFESVAIFIFILWLSSAISAFINFFFGHEQQQLQGKRSKIGSMMLLIRLAIWILGFFIAVAAAGIPIDKLSIMIGALGVGIGFGLQNIVNNLVSGIILAFERPIQVGDLIEVGGKLGVVKEIGVRSSKINNNAGADIIVPNGDLLSQHLTNWTMQDRNKQIDFTMGIPYNSDIKNVRNIILEILENNDKIMTEHHPAVMINQFGEKTIDLKVVFWVYDLANGGSVRTNAMIDIYEKLAGAGIHLPVATEVLPAPEAAPIKDDEPKKD